jgi:hypothetical protein
MARDKAGRNDLCGCGSGKKFKRCCAIKQQKARGSRLMTIVVFAVIAVGIAAAIASFKEEGSSIPMAGKVWSPEHGHYH